MTRYGSIDAWVDMTKKRLVAWGFNTLGGWSSDEVKRFPRTVYLGFAGRHTPEGGLPDFFHSDYAARAAKVAARVESMRDDPYVIGYFLDNELDWAPHWRRPLPIFEQYLKRPPDAPGKKALVRFFRERYDSVGEFGKVWAPPIESWSALAERTSLRPRNRAAATEDREAFTYLVACQYFRVATEALRKADPNHLILGSRFVSWLVPRTFVQACGRFCDVVSLNFYEVGPLGHAIFKVVDPETAFEIVLPGARRLPHDTDFRPFYETSGKPILITEFSFRSMDSGMPNTYPPPVIAQPTVPTQRDRADKYRRYVREWVTSPYCVGYHWFQYQDQPKGGRGDGENGNYGLVNIQDEPYAEFIRQVRQLNRQAYGLHAGESTQRVD
jgi:hypothetical protein